MKQSDFNSTPLLCNKFSGQYFVFMADTGLSLRHWPLGAAEETSRKQQLTRGLHCHLPFASGKLSVYNSHPPVQ